MAQACYLVFALPISVVLTAVQRQRQDLCQAGDTSLQQAPEADKTHKSLSIKHLPGKGGDEKLCFITHSMYMINHICFQKKTSNCMALYKVRYLHG